MDTTVHSLLDTVLDTHPTALIATVAENAPQFTETPYAFTRTADTLSLAYAVPEGSAAHRALRRRNGVAFRIGTPTDAAWLEGTGRAVIVHDTMVNDDLLAPDRRTHASRAEAGGADTSRRTHRAGDGDGRDPAGRRGAYATDHLRAGRAAMGLSGEHAQ